MIIILLVITLYVSSSYSVATKELLVSREFFNHLQGLVGVDVGTDGEIEGLESRVATQEVRV